MTSRTSKKSMINLIGGLPVGGKPEGKRVFLFTSWTRKGIEAALKKVRQVEHKRLAIQKHYGVSGVEGDLWYSFVAVLNSRWTLSNMLNGARPRYGMSRYVWTRSDEDA